jgi:hypothetical protein
MANSQNSDLGALVFGASGITGWAIVKIALEYPSPTTFSRVIGLTNRPLTLKDSFLPSDPRLSLKSGVDLSGDVVSIVEALKKIDGIEKITHVYFTGERIWNKVCIRIYSPSLAYVHKAWGANGSTEQIRANVELLMNSVKAVEQLCPGLQFVTWPSGGKW